MARLALLVATMLVIAACGGDTEESGQLEVVATTSIWGDVVHEIVGDDANVTVLIPEGSDAHDYQPTPRQIAALHGADLVVANGLGLEEGLHDMLENAAADGANIFEVAPDLDPLPFAAHDHVSDDEDAAEEEEHEDHGTLDPHVWFDPIRMATAARLIAERLSNVDPSIDWDARAESYAGELEETDQEIAAMTSAIPEDDRKLVTNHEAMGYFADRYGFEVVAVVIPGGSTLADPSSAELADLVEEIEHEGVGTIFAETTQPTRLAEAVAAEVGSTVTVVELYTESLGDPQSGADSLVGMLLTDATLIVDALSG